jgi:uncharacterized protein with FMN-binding domain
MKKITFWALSTLSAVVLLFGYHTSTSATLAASAATASAGSTYSATASPAGSASTGTSGATSTTGSTDQSSDTSGSASSGSTSSTSSGSSTTKVRTVTGEVAQTRWGPVQVELTLTGTSISKVSVLQYPSGNGKDDEINSYALPILTQETISAQSASIDMVSGATVTSDGYLQSLQSAIDQAGI